MDKLLSDEDVKSKHDSLKLSHSWRALKDGKLRNVCVNSAAYDILRSFTYPMNENLDIVPEEVVEMN